ncbi:MAG: hypothetical protein ACFE8A_10520 [Candidatus Hodarchaeota archaeon]
MELKVDLRVCENCGVALEARDYFYRHKTPNAPGGYICHSCGYYLIRSKKIRNK